MEGLRMDLAKYQQQSQVVKTKKRQPVARVRPRKEFEFDPVLITKEQAQQLSMDSMLGVAKEAGIDVDMRYLTMEEQHSVSYHWMRGTRGLAHKQADRFRKERRNRLRKLDAVEDVFA